MAVSTCCLKIVKRKTKTFSVSKLYNLAFYVEKKYLNKTRENLINMIIKELALKKTIHQNMVVHTFNVSTPRVQGQSGEFQDSQDYILRSCLFYLLKKNSIWGLEK